MAIRFQWARAAAAVVTCAVAAPGCARRRAARAPQAEPVVTPADAPPREAAPRYAEGELRPGWKRYVQRKTIAPGETVTVGPEPYARVKLVEVAEDRMSAVFQAQHLVDHRHGRVRLGGSFSEFTAVFGKKGATLEKLDGNRATVVFRWAQNSSTAVPPGAEVEGE